MRVIKAVMFKELLNTVRDRRTLIISVFVPILMMPALMFGSNYLTRDDAPLPVAVHASAEVSPDVLCAFDALPLQIIDSEDPVAALRAGDVALFVELEVEDDGHAAVIHHSAEPRSVRALEVVGGRLEALNRSLAEQRLAAQGLDPRIMTSISVAVQTVEGHRKWSMPAVLFPLVVIVWAMMGAMYPAADVTAGEKERKTLESLLMTPAGDGQMMIGKFLAVCLVSLITVILAVLATAATIVAGEIDSMMFVGLDISARLVVFGGLVVVATISLMSSSAMAVSAYARSFKEAQTYLTPIFMLVILPSLFIVVAPHLLSVRGLYFIPFIGNSFVFSDVAMGAMDPMNMGAVMISNFALSAALLWYSARAMRSEAARQA